MIRIVVDTNILISALLTTTGNSAQIVDKIFLEELLPIYCSSIIDEYAAVLSRPRFNFSEDEQKRNHLRKRMRGAHLLSCEPSWAQPDGVLQVSWVSREHYLMGQQ